MSSPAPFSHDSLDLKRHFLEIARKFHENRNKDGEEGVAYELAAALMYMNLADYLAQYVAYGVTYLGSEAIGEYHLGVISMRKPSPANVTFEQSIRMLEPYDFPRKGDIITSLNKVKKSRNKLAHEILKTDPDKLGEVDDAVTDLRDDTEELINIVDQLQSGMPPRNLKGK